MGYPLPQKIPHLRFGAAWRLPSYLALPDIPKLPGYFMRSGCNLLNKVRQLLFPKMHFKSRNTKRGNNLTGMIE